MGGAPPAKALQLNTGEKLPVPGEVSEDSDKESPLQKRRGTETKRGAGKRPRTRSFSNSDPVSPKPSPDGEGGAVGGTKNSPVTRSNSATMKAPEFVSLPSRRRRGGRRGGRGRGSSFSVRASEEVEMEDDSIGESLPPSPHNKTPTKAAGPDPPVKRKRGRPPKIRKDTPESSKKSSEASKGTKGSNKTSESVDENKTRLWDNDRGEKESDEATPTDVYKTTSTSLGGKKGSNKEVEKDAPKSGKTRKGSQKTLTADVSSEDAPTSNDIAEIEATSTKRTRSKSKTKEADKNDKETTESVAAEGSKEEAVKQDEAPPTTQSVIVSGSAPHSEGGSAGGEMEETDKAGEQDVRPVSTQDPPLPPASSPTGTYMHPYPYPGPYPHPPPIMYPPAPSSYHPYYGYPGAPPSGAYHVPPPGMMVPPPHPGSPMGERVCVCMHA